MIAFLKLTSRNVGHIPEQGESVWVNLASVDSVVKLSTGSRLALRNGQYQHVTETPDQIMKLLESAQDNADPA